MTKECEQVIRTVGFSDSEYKTVEYFLTKVSAQKLISLVRGKKKSDVQNAEWFRPFIERGYIKSYDLKCSFSEDFWKAYTIFDSVCPLCIDDLPYIDTMSKDKARMRKALSASRVMNVRYIYKVWESTPEEKIVNNADKVQMVFKSSVTKTVDFGRVEDEEEIEDKKDDYEEFEVR